VRAGTGRVPRSLRALTQASCVRRGCIHAPVADEREQRGTVRPDAELPVDVAWRRAPGADDALMDAVQMVCDADGDAICRRVSAAAGAKLQVMIVQVPA